MEFKPFVTLIPVGSRIEFPNLDSVQHHVFSFSKPKVFDIPLYKTSAPPPVVFDVPGVVVIGCNIHDWMKAYIFVTDAQYYVKTDGKGKAQMVLPPEEYRFEVWHPLIKGIVGDSLAKPIRVAGNSVSPLRIILDLKRKIRLKRSPSLGDSGGYQ